MYDIDVKINKQINKNYHRDWHPDNIQRVRDIGEPSPK